MEKEILTITQVADLLQVSKSKVYEFIADKENPLPVFYLSDRTPRVNREDLNKWMQTQKELSSNDKSELKGGE